MASVQPRPRVTDWITFVRINEDEHTVQVIASSPQSGEEVVLKQRILPANTEVSLVIRQVLDL